MSAGKGLRNELMQGAPLADWHYVYMVRCSNDSLYTGYTKDVEQRIVAHNAGKGGQYTQAHRPVALVRFWQFGTKRSAMQVEYRIKQMTRVRKVAISEGREIPLWACWDREQSGSAPCSQDAEAWLFKCFVTFRVRPTVAMKILCPSRRKFHLCLLHELRKIEINRARSKLY